MTMLLRHLLSIMLLPFVVIIVIPFGLLTRFTALDSSLTDFGAIDWGVRFVGALTIFLGVILFAWCVTLFAKIGQGTLAPWDPTRHLIAHGPYRFMRNPMISGVVLMLAGQALWWGSSAIGLWAGLFISINHLYFVLAEEPGLEKRFGESYRLYKANVPRWVPRRHPWLG